MSKLADYRLPGIDGWELPLDRFEGEVVLVVNVASRCGLTPQYAALEALHRRFNDLGFLVLGVPCNQFAGAAASRPGNISWNFEKFLIGRNGQVIERYAPTVKPDAPEVLAAIARALA